MSENANKSELGLSQLGRSGIQNPAPLGEEIGLHSIMHIASGKFPGQNYVNVKYNIVVQGEWRLARGNTGGVTHCACVSTNADELYFNYTTDFELQTTSLCKFPCVLFTVYGMDLLGRSVVLGYGQTPLAQVDGVCNREIDVFKPKSHTWLSEIIGKLKGTPTELINPKETVVNNEGREFIRTEAVGSLSIEFDTKRIKWAENGFQ